MAAQGLEESIGLLVPDGDVDPVEPPSREAPARTSPGSLQVHTLRAYPADLHVLA